MSARTTRIFRDDGLFDFLSKGPILLDRLDGQGARRHIATAFAFTFMLLAAGNTLLAYENGNRLLTSIAGGLTAALAIAFLVKLWNSILGGKRKPWGNKGPLPIVLSDEGITQLVPESEDLTLPWSDIRLVRNRGDYHSVRGSDRKIQVDISTRLAWSEEATALVKFLFVLRQEMGDAWSGAIPALRKRLSEGGLYIYRERTRKSFVILSTQGITYEESEGNRTSLSWDEIDQSIFDRKKNYMRFRHVKSRTNLDIPTDLESMVVFDQIVRWAMHSDPVFGIG
jgi:hypothetical protein